MSDDERFKDQAAIARFAKVKYPTSSDATMAYDAAELLLAERSSRRSLDGVTLTRVELESLREAIRAIDENYSETFRPAFSVAMAKRGMAKVGVEVALRKILGQ